jgi:hypothetical protein
MNYTKSLVGALAALAAGAFLHGQSTAASSTTAGVLGQRYVGAGVFVDDFRDTSIDSGIGGGLLVNLPVASALDVAFEYSYERVDDSLLDGREHAIAATLRAYNAYEGVKLFSDVTLGYAWDKIKAPSVGRITDNDGFWAVGVGVEAPIASSTALVGRVAYGDRFDGDDSDAWTFTVGANHWFTPKLVGAASVSFQEDDAVLYTIGLGLRF